MNRRRVTLTLGTAAGGLLGTAFLPMAVALADDNFTFVPDPRSNEDVVAVGGIPPLNEDVHGTQLFDLEDTTTTNTEVASFNADVSIVTTASGFSNADIVVSPNPPLFPPGSVFDVAKFGSGFENIYSDIVRTGTGGTNSITDTFVTPFGTFNIPTDFDAATVPSADFKSPDDTFSYVPVSNSPNVTSDRRDSASFPARFWDSNF